MNEITALRLIRDAVAEVADGFPLKSDPTVPFESSPAGYLELRLRHGWDSFRATELSAAVLIAVVGVFLPLGQGAGPCLSLAGAVARHFKNLTLLAPDGDTGCLIYQRSVVEGPASPYVDNGVPVADARGRSFAEAYARIEFRNFTN